MLLGYERGKWKREKIGCDNLPCLLAFVTVRALFGIKAIRRDAEHVVALDADTVDHRADDGAGLERLVCFRRKGSGGFF